MAITVKDFIQFVEHLSDTHPDVLSLNLAHLVDTDEENYTFAEIIDMITTPTTFGFVTSKKIFAELDSDTNFKGQE